MNPDTAISTGIVLPLLPDELDSDNSCDDAFVASPNDMIVEGNDIVQEGEDILMGDETAHKKRRHTDVDQPKK